MRCCLDTKWSNPSKVTFWPRCGAPPSTCRATYYHFGTIGPDISRVEPPITPDDHQLSPADLAGIRSREYARCAVGRRVIDQPAFPSENANPGKAEDSTTSTAGIDS